MATPDSTFLVRASETAFDLGADGYRVTHVRIRSREIGAVDTGAAAGPPRYEEGEPPVPGREGRRAYHWQPAADAPAWMQLAWLIEDVATWVGVLAEEHVELLGVETSRPEWCDVLARTDGTEYRVRFALTDREELLDFPGMYLRDMFADRRQQRYAAGEESGALLVDLREVF